MRLHAPTLTSPQRTAGRGSWAAAGGFGYPVAAAALTPSGLPVPAARWLSRGWPCHTGAGAAEAPGQPRLRAAHLWPLQEQNEPELGLVAPQMHSPPWPWFFSPVSRLVATPKPPSEEVKAACRVSPLPNLTATGARGPDRSKRAGLEGPSPPATPAPPPLLSSPRGLSPRRGQGN